MYNEKELCYENTENYPSVIRKSLMSCLISATTLTSFHGHLSSWQPASGVHTFPAAIHTWCTDVTGDRERAHKSQRFSLSLQINTSILFVCSAAAQCDQHSSSQHTHWHKQSRHPLTVSIHSCLLSSAQLKHTHLRTHKTDGWCRMSIYYIYARNAPIRYRSQSFQLICKLSVDCHC